MTAVGFALPCDRPAPTQEATACPAVLTPDLDLGARWQSLARFCAISLPKG